MTERTKYLYLNQDNDLIWVNEDVPLNKFKEQLGADVQLDEIKDSNSTKKRSMLDINVKDGDFLTLLISKFTMPHWAFANNPKPKYTWGSGTPISIKNAVDRGEGISNGKGEFWLKSVSKDKLVLEHIKSRNPTKPGGNDGAKFDFDFCVVNAVLGTETIIMIDPILVNDGLGSP